MAELGFLLEPHAGGPIPDSNDLVALALVLGVALVLPLSARVGLGFALVIASIMYTAVLTPIVLAHQWPAVAPGPGRGKIAVAFPVLSGLIAAALGIGISVTWNSITLTHPEGGTWLDFARGWTRYIGRGYPWVVSTPSWLP